MAVLGNWCCCCCSGIAPRAQLLMKSAWLLHLIGDRAPTAARNNDEVARALNQRCDLQTGNSGHSWCSRSSPSSSVGFSIQDEAMEVAWSTPQGAHYHVDVKVDDALLLMGLLVCKLVKAILVLASRWYIQFSGTLVKPVDIHHFP